MVSRTAVALLSSLLVAQTAVAQSTALFRLEEVTIADLNAAFDAGGLTCQQLVRLYLDRIAAYEDGGPKLNSITTVNSNALATAAALDSERRRLGRRRALHCIPVLLKDNIDAPDMPTSNGSVILKDAIPPDAAYITRALREAGALILGKAAMGEFAGGSYNTVDGQTVNPYNFKRQTGGSSSGPGAAVAANLTLLAIGTDTSTSVRGPSSFNGIVGLRPTTGLISRDGIAPKNLNFDTAGPMARTVTDVARLLTVIAGADPKDPASVDVYNHYPSSRRTEGPGRGYADFTKFLKKGSLKGARLGVVRDFFGGDPEIDALAKTAIAKMQDLGAHLVDVHLDPEFLDFYVRNGAQNIRRIADYRFKRDWETYLTRFGPGVPKTVAEFVEIYETKVAKSPLPVDNSVLDLLKRSLVTSTDDPAYQNLINNVLPTATRLKLAIFDTSGVDALVFPYQPTFAAPINNPVSHIDDPAYVAAPGRPDPAIMAGYSSVGFPGIVVPMGLGSQGLPMTISFMGRPYDEGRLLSYAYDYEQATLLRRPSPLVPPLPGEVIKYQPSKRAR